MVSNEAVCDTGVYEHLTIWARGKCMFFVLSTEPI